MMRTFKKLHNLYITDIVIEIESVEQQITSYQRIL